MPIINIAHAGVITDAPSISTVGINVLNFLLSVAGIFAIIALVISGITYFTSVGDEKRAELAKKIATYAILGIVLLMGAMVVIRLIGQFFAKI